MTEGPSSRLFKARFQDYLLAAAIVCSSVLWIVSPGAAGAGACAKLSLGGRTLAELPLDRPARRSFELGGGRVTVEVEPGRGVRIAESNCPAKVCVHTGWAHASGESVVCLPNKLIITVEGGASEYDAVIR